MHDSFHRSRSGAGVAVAVALGVAGFGCGEPVLAAFVSFDSTESPACVGASFGAAYEIAPGDGDWSLLVFSPLPASVSQPVMPETFVNDELWVRDQVAAGEVRFVCLAAGAVQIHHVLYDGEESVKGGTVHATCQTCL